MSDVLAKATVSAYDYVHSEMDDMGFLGGRLCYCVYGSVSLKFASRQKMLITITYSDSHVQ